VPINDVLQEVKMDNTPSFDASPKPVKISVMARLRSWFFTGLLVTAPVMLTLYITWLFIDIIDAQVVGLIPSGLRDYITLKAPIAGQLPGVGLLVGVVTITLIGALAAGFLGRWLIRIGENLLNRMPVVRSIYGASKQILETVLSAQSDAFREVVLVEYPRKGLWVIGFVTGSTKGEVQASIRPKTVNVFIPTTPNPTSGFLLFCPENEISYLEMSVEDAVKLVVSGGIVTPPSPQKLGKSANLKTAKKTTGKTARKSAASKTAVKNKAAPPKGATKKGAVKKKS
jgi:uncharacterized membrane protein